MRIPRGRQVSLRICKITTTAHPARTYRITSLEEELKDKDTKITEATKKAARSVRFLYVMIIAVVLVVVEATVPGTLEEYVLDPRFLSHIGTRTRCHRF